MNLQPLHNTLWLKYAPYISIIIYTALGFLLQQYWHHAITEKAQQLHNTISTHQQAIRPLDPKPADQLAFYHQLKTGTAKLAHANASIEKNIIQLNFCSSYPQLQQWLQSNQNMPTQCQLRDASFAATPSCLKTEITFTC